MNVQELSVLHHRYVGLSHRFRAAWVFHQFLQSLQKVFDTGIGNRYSEEFQRLYAELKEVSQGLTASENERTQGRLDLVRDRLASLTVSLAEEDNKISPALLRRFLQRFDNYDEKLLLQLARFYVVCSSMGFSGTDRVDKLDFILTRLSQQPQEGGSPVVITERKRLAEIFQSLWTLSGADPPIERLVDEKKRQIHEIRTRLPEVTSLDELNEEGLLRLYREVKHGLGELFLEPELTTAVVETNLEFRNVVHRLYSQDERKIIADYQEVFELERETPVDMQLDGELTQFRREVERFERQLQEDELRLAELFHIREQTRSLRPRLKGATPLRDAAGPQPGESASKAARPPAPAPLPAGGELPFAKEYRDLLQTLEGCDPASPPRAVALSPEVYALRLEPREVEAYRRLANGGGAAVGERFLLEAAALRVRLHREAEEIGGLLDETSRSAEAPIYREARETLAMAGDYLHRFEHLTERQVLADDLDEARRLMILRMRLVQEYAGVWLLAYRPFLKP